MNLRRLCAFSVLGLLLALLGMYLVQPVWVAERDYDLWRDKALRTIARYQAATAQQKAIEIQLQALQQLPLWSRLYTARDRKGAETTVRQDVQTLLTQSGLMGTLTVAQNTAPGVRVDCSFTTSIDHLQALLQAVDTHNNYLQIAALEVSAPSVQDHSVNPLLRIHLAVRGFWRQETKA